jgi:S-adenosylmethionine:diacylglycerol 3-amino-3-carboxypropyl transferase
MKLKECLELGQDCGLETMREAIKNVYIHSSNMFIYSEIKKELDELYVDAYKLIDNTSFTSDSKIQDILELIRKDDYYGN